jgi:hypothetical protein
MKNLNTLFKKINFILLLQLKIKKVKGKEISQ